VQNEGRRIFYLDDLATMETQVSTYVEDVLVSNLASGEAAYAIEKSIVADYNINFVILIGQTRYLFRVNVEQQSGLENQIEYEYNTLNFLADQKIAPRAYFLDSTKTILPFAILVEEYLDGDYLSYDDLSGIQEAARLLAILHTTPLPTDHFFRSWSNPLEDSLKDVLDLFEKYSVRKTRDEKITTSIKKLIGKLEKRVASSSDSFSCESLVHTDVVNDNFIRSPQGLRLIDWEKPRIDDPSYDLCVFLGAPSELWSSPRTMTDSEKEVFLQEYCRHSGKEFGHIREQLRIRQPYVSAHWVLWAANRLADLMEGAISAELIQFHAQSISRYKKVASSKHIEMILDELGK
jgi:thiamine kinase-like enzyme